MKDYIEILVCKWLIKRIKKGYGANCTSKDIDTNNKYPRCASCEAKETIEWLEKNIELIKS